MYLYVSVLLNLPRCSSDAAIQPSSHRGYLMWRVQGPFSAGDLELLQGRF